MTFIRAHGRDVTAARVAALLPHNYKITQSPAPGTYIVEGEDVAGWTAEGYVIPRLASGLIVAEVIG